MAGGFVGVGLGALDYLLSVAARVAPITQSCVRRKGVGEASGRAAPCNTRFASRTRRQ